LNHIKHKCTGKGKKKEEGELSNSTKNKKCVLYFFPKILFPSRSSKYLLMKKGEQQFTVVMFVFFVPVFDIFLFYKVIEE